MGALNVVRKFFPNVKRVTDAKTNALIEVTKADVQSKAVKNHNACAMAVACRRKFHLDGVIISRSIAYLVKGNRARRFKLNESVSREVVSFDRGAGFAPGRYELAKISPSSAMALGGRPNRPKDSAERDGTPPRFRHITTNVRSVLGGQKETTNA